MTRLLQTVDDCSLTRLKSLLRCSGGRLSRLQSVSRGKDRLTQASQDPCEQVLRSHSVSGSELAAAESRSQSPSGRMRSPSAELQSVRAGLRRLKKRITQGQRIPSPSLLG